MNGPFDEDKDPEALRMKIIGLGERSVRKSFYPALQQRAAELERFRALLDQTRDAIFLIQAPEGKVADVNESACVQLGYSREELLAAEVESFLTPAAIQAFLDLGTRQSSDNPPGVIEAEAVRRDGRRFPVELTLRNVQFLGSAYVVIVARDITLRKLAEEERLQLATAIEQATEGIIITDTKWNIQYVNPAFERMSGYTKSEIVGGHTSILKSDKHDEDYYANIRDTLAKGQAWSGRLIIRRKDGELYHAEVTGSPVRDKPGAVINHVSIHRDVTHEVKLERELRQALKMEAIGTLAGGIAHDFNNILTAIMGAAQMALHKLPPTSPARPYLDQIQESGCRAGDLVRRILTFSRQTEQVKMPVQVVPILEEALKMLRSSLPSTIEIRHNIEVPPEEGKILGDPTEIHQALMNLSANAAHAMRSTGGILSVTLSSVVVDSYLASTHRDLKIGPYLCLAVSDTGHGIDPAVIERVFDPYFTTKGPGEGTGMGLAVVQGIVKRHAGAIVVYSEVGAGTTFRIFLPRAEGKLAPADHAAEEFAGGSQRILFVDDEKILVDLGKEMLEALGYSVTAQTSSREALEVFRAGPHSFDLVITDMTMPGLTGVELARELLAIRDDIPIILCTGFSELANGRPAMETGICELVMKPYVVGNLTKSIRRALEKS